MKQRVIIGFLGTTLDAAGKRGHLARWHPSVAMISQPGFHIDRVELLHGSSHTTTAARVTKTIEQISPATDVRCHTMEFDNPWDFAEMYGKLADFAQSYPFQPEREDYFLQITTGTHVAQICWFLLAEARLIPARLLQLSPPDAQERDEGDFRGHYSIIDLNLARYDSIAQRFAADKQNATAFLKSGIATRNPKFNKLIDEIETVVLRSGDPVLLSGPTGAGKSQLARRIYDLKRQKRLLDGAFIEVNCATLRDTHAISSLFGHAKGAFTGAQSQRQGLMRAADKGLLFLDEVAELGLDEQAMLLRAIEDKSFLPLGADTPVKSDFQLITGSNQDLRHAVAQGRFRDDLFARLNLWTFHLPGLAERREDIEPNLDYELEQFSIRQGQRLTMNSEARTAFLSFALSPQAVWRGNFRDLHASITRMGTLCEQARIDTDVVKNEIQRLLWMWWRDDVLPSPTDTLALDALGNILPDPHWRDHIDRFDQAGLAAAVQACQQANSLSEAGRNLYQASRLNKAKPNDADRLRKYLARFGLDYESVRKLAP